MNQFPAEWAPHIATWLAWPHNEETWPGRQRFMPSVWIQMIKALHVHEKVHLLVNDNEMKDHVNLRLKKADINMENVSLHLIPTNDCWMRDIGPTFVKTDPTRQTSPTGLTALCWIFNSWGEKWPPWDQDAKVATHIAEVAKTPLLRPDIVLEGGSIETNGEGTLLTTETCLLHPKRNSDISKGDIEKKLKQFLGVEKILWLKGEPLPGDDTSGHIDTLVRFVSPDTVVSQIPLESEDSKALRKMTTAKGERFKVIQLPEPPKVEYQGDPLPASYANFYLANGLVLLPSFNSPQDSEVFQIFKKLFPKRRIVPIDSTALVGGFGGIHCVTQQQPA